MIPKDAVLHRKGDRRKCRAAKNAKVREENQDTKNQRLNDASHPLGECEKVISKLISLRSSPLSVFAVRVLG